MERAVTHTEPSVIQGQVLAGGRAITTEVQVEVEELLILALAVEIPLEVELLLTPGDQEVGTLQDKKEHNLKERKYHG